ncbi:MAG: hypothetical protein CSYNP_03196 [Syntrophus sp. SKADARSKE-3]|nr:hypothetical protein [Syntrophus sp. SKADARSKE-3]
MTLIISPWFCELNKSATCASRRETQHDQNIQEADYLESQKHAKISGLANFFTQYIITIG